MEDALEGLVKGQGICAGPLAQLKVNCVFILRNVGILFVSRLFLLDQYSSLSLCLMSFHNQQLLRQTKDGSFISKLASRAINVYASLPETCKSENALNTKEITLLAAGQFVQICTSIAPATRASVLLTLAKALIRQAQQDTALQWLDESQKILEVHIFSPRSISPF